MVLSAVVTGVTTVPLCLSKFMKSFFLSYCLFLQGCPSYPPISSIIELYDCNLDTAIEYLRFLKNPFPS